MKDPFEDFLEDAMSGPDLELGHDMRRRLLEAAVAGTAIEGENVVRIASLDPAEQEGFDWIAGEIETNAPLMNRMIGDAVFLASLDQDRHFLRTLRHALLKQAVVTTPAKWRRFLPAAVISAAAALALAAGAIFYGGTGSNDSSDAVVAATEIESPPTEMIPELSVPLPISRSGEPETTSEVAVMEAPAPSPEVFSLVPLPNVEVDQSINALAGSGQSIGTDDLPARGGISMLAAVEEISGSAEAISLLDDSTKPEIASNFRHSPMMEGPGFGLPSVSGPSMSFATNQGRESIPEPGVAMPVLIGMVILFLRRERPSKR